MCPPGEEQGVGESAGVENVLQHPRISGDGDADSTPKQKTEVLEEECFEFDAETSADMDSDNGPGSGTFDLEELILQVQGAVRTADHSVRTVFKRVPGVSAPVLRKGRLNEIILYLGCFNPPHRAHRELLTHAFLRTDADTIAALIVPIDLEAKDDSGILLRKEDRVKLWEDEVLARFSWIYDGAYQDVWGFMENICLCAKDKGIDLTFTWLSGPDHHEKGIKCGSHNIIITDVARAADLLVTADGAPLPQSSCGGWTKILPPPGTKSRYPSSPCAKLGRYFPEYFDEDREKKIGFFDEDAELILGRCNDPLNTIWRAFGPNGNKVLLLLSGRRYPQDDRRFAFSSTKLRELLGSSPVDWEAVEKIAINPGQLRALLEPGSRGLDG